MKLESSVRSRNCEKTTQNYDFESHVESRLPCTSSWSGRWTGARIRAWTSRYLDGSERLLNDTPVAASAPAIAQLAADGTVNCSLFVVTEFAGSAQANGSTSDSSLDPVVGSRGDHHEQVACEFLGRGSRLREMAS